MSDPCEVTGLADCSQCVHDDLQGITTDNHHPILHTHDGVDGSGVVAAASVTYAGGVGMSATNVEGALDELADEKLMRASIATYADRKTRTSILTLNSTSWANLENSLDIVLTAQTGDFIEVGASLFWSSENVDAFLDVVTIVGGVPVNSFGHDAPPPATGTGILGLAAAVSVGRAGSVIRQQAAGDIDAGTVRLRWRYKTGTAANKGILAIPDVPMVVWARNHG